MRYGVFYSLKFVDWLRKTNSWSEKLKNSERCAHQATEGAEKIQFGFNNNNNNNSQCDVLLQLVYLYIKYLNLIFTHVISQCIDWFGPVYVNWLIKSCKQTVSNDVYTVFVWCWLPNANKDTKKYLYINISLTVKTAQILACHR